MGAIAEENQRMAENALDVTPSEQAPSLQALYRSIHNTRSAIEVKLLIEMFKEAAKVPIHFHESHQHQEDYRVLREMHKDVVSDALNNVATSISDNNEKARRDSLKKLKHFTDDLEPSKDTILQKIGYKISDTLRF